MEKNWVLLYSSGEPHKIEFIKGLLSENNIRSIDINKKDSSYLLGEIELYVNRNEVLKAKYIIDKNKL